MARTQSAEKTVSDLTSRVNLVETQTQFRTVDAVYKSIGGERKKISDAKYEPRDYRYFEIVEGKVPSLRALQDAVADIHDHGEYSVSNLIADLNYGMFERRRDDMRQGIDPTLTPKQRETLVKVRELLADGVADAEMAEMMLTRVGFDTDRIAVELASFAA